MLLLCANAPADDRPSILLVGATPDEARALAIDSALARGWTLVAEAQAEATFEQILEPSAQGDGEPPRLVLRVYAQVHQESAGARVLLAAEEIESSDGAGQWSRGVTRDYRDNLITALDNLRVSWESATLTLQPSDTPTSAREPGLGRGGQTPPSNPDSFGTWAYYAEGLAVSLGCVLDDRGALLESSGADWEIHRVACQDGRTLRIHCLLGECTTRH